MSKITSLVFLVCIAYILQTGLVFAQQTKLFSKQSPEKLYKQLFQDVQLADSVFNDSKFFVDCIPLYNVQTINNHYAKLKNKSDSSILAFVKEHFDLPMQSETYTTDSAGINEHITKLWNVLQRPADKKQVGSLIALPYPYIVPGGRFREVYYWDSYFTLLGLQTDGRLKAMENIVDNFSFLIDTFGFIPNGNRTYYLSRSQPPFYSLMIDELAQMKGDSIYGKYLFQLLKEYTFWMDGIGKLNNRHTHYRRVVLLPDGEVLNRYWDDQDTPRPESYQEDLLTAQEAMLNQSHRHKNEVYRNIRAAAESGWDFSSRWLIKDTAHQYPLYSIHTTDIIPVDLNTLLFHLEETIAHAYKLLGENLLAEAYKQKSKQRKKALLKYCWNEKEAFFMDYDFKKQQSTDCYSLAGVFPLSFKLANEEQASLVANKIKQDFLKDGGLIATLNETLQQWDKPNGWAPLQWMAIIGLRNYGKNTLADEVKIRWLRVNQEVYYTTFKLLEKYNVVDLTLKGGGGEYPNQDGFGWTNGVYQKLSKE